MEKPTQHFDVYALVTDLIIQKLEDGIIPWKQPWTKQGLPRNLITQRPYTGINVWLLNSMLFEQNLFLTFNQVQELNASIIKGSKSIPVIFWKKSEKEDPETNEIKKTSILRYYNVFNVSQCEGLPKDLVLEVEANFNNPIEMCDSIVFGMPDTPKIKHQGDDAFYDPILDYINMPLKKRFKESTSYYGVLFHELIHSTGHEKRLGRKGITEKISFGTETYSQEELIAEIGACYLKSFAGIESKIDNSVAYIQHWLEKLKNDKRFIIFASANAQKAADYILNLSAGENEGMNESVTLF